MDQALNLSKKFQSAPSSGNLICSPEVIFDKKKIQGQIRTACKDSSDTGLRSKLSAILQETYVQGRLAIEAAYIKTPFDTRKVTTSYTYLTDKIVYQAFNISTKILHPAPEKGKLNNLTMMAVGGYGRAEMAPY